MVVGVALSSAAAGAGPSKDAKGGAIKPDALYKQYCSVCHGENGDGRSRAQRSLTPPPRNFTDPAQHSRLTRDYMIGIVRNGKPGTAMVSWTRQLNDAEVAAVVDYIRSAYMKVDPGAQAAKGRETLATAASSAHQPHDHGPAPSNDHDQAHHDHGQHGPANMAARLPKGLAGDAERGRKLFEANCVPCHGKKGDGKGPRAYFIRPKPRNFMDEHAQEHLNRPALFKSISDGRNGTDMPAWSKVLPEQQRADLAEFVFRQFVGPAVQAKAAGRK